MALRPVPQDTLFQTNSLLHHLWLVAVLALHSSGGGKQRPPALKDTGFRALLLDPDLRRWEMPVYFMPKAHALMNFIWGPKG